MKPSRLPSLLLILVASLLNVACQDEISQPQPIALSPDGAAFLKTNAAQPGVVTLDSGLQYRVLKEGDGETPKATDTVTVHYRGTLIDGTEFDSSYKRGKPTSFSVNRVIAGWTEALQLMQVGDKWQLTIPSDLAYGSRSPGAGIPPDAVLVFEVELLSVQ
jgi:FKBP-type peptidyl-prolyl cis-trans isomerase